MKRKELVTGLALGAAITGAAVAFTGCRNEKIEAVYGPPDAFEKPVEQEEPADAEDPEADDQEGGTDAPELIDDYDPSLDEIEEVYGPPSMFDDYDEEGNVYNQTAYNPEDELIEAVYGPPPDDSWFREQASPADMLGIGESHSK